MFDLDQLLDDAKKSAAIPSDYALAKAIEVTKQTISAYRKGTAFPNDDHLADLATLAKRDPLLTIAEARLSRSRKDSGRKAWRRIIAAVAAKGASPSAFSSGLDNPLFENGISVLRNIVCILCKKTEAGNLVQRIISERRFSS